MKQASDLPFDHVHDLCIDLPPSRLLLRLELATLLPRLVQVDALEVIWRTLLPKKSRLSGPITRMTSLMLIDDPWELILKVLLVPLGGRFFLGDQPDVMVESLQ